MKFFAVILFFVFCLFEKLLTAQPGAPDTLFTDLNDNIPGYSWQFSVVQITDTHIGQGSRGRDYGTPGYEDSLRQTDHGRQAQRMSDAVKWVNSNAERLKIKFVVFSGDLTNNAEKSQFLKFKQIADSLVIPYIPMMGNHDLWPNTSQHESPFPNGDSICNAVFSDRFNLLQSQFTGWDDGTRLKRVWYADGQCYSYFQNFSFRYGSYIFMFTDFAPRVHAIKRDKGVGPEADLLSYKGGSWHYFKKFVKNAEGKQTKNMIFFSHYPLTKHFWSFIAGFPFCDYIKMTRFLAAYRSSCAAWIAGHFHYDKEFTIKTWLLPTPIMKGVETDANADFKHGHVRVVRIWDKATE